MLRFVPVLLAAALALAAPPGRAADLVVWWEKGYNPEEDAAVRENVAAFEQETGKQVELVQPEEGEIADRALAALEAGQPPDFLFGTSTGIYISEWAFEDRLVDLTATVGALSNMFDPEALAWWLLPNRKTGQKGVYGLPIGRTSNHVHVWTSLLQKAGFTLEDIPKEWDAFWSFWCDQVQPAVRRATGRDDIWGIGLNMSEAAGDVQNQFLQFLAVYDADYVTREGRLVMDEPEVRRKLIKAIDSYTQIYRKGCTPSSSIRWNSGSDNNKQFSAQAVVMTLNNTLSIPNALKHERPDDYYRNTATIEWPLGPDGEDFPIRGDFWAAAVFREGSNLYAAKDFVRFLVDEGWLAHYLNFAGERFLPPMPQLLDAPFWLDPSDPHRMAAAMQIASRPMQHDYITVTGDWRHDQVWQEMVWPKAIHRVVTEGVSPEQAVDEAIARVKEILSE